MISPVYMPIEHENRITIPAGWAGMVHRHHTCLRQQLLDADGRDDEIPCAGIGIIGDNIEQDRLPRYGV